MTTITILCHDKLDLTPVSIPSSREAPDLKEMKTSNQVYVITVYRLSTRVRPQTPFHENRAAKEVMFPDGHGGKGDGLREQEAHKEIYERKRVCILTLLSWHSRLGRLM